MDTDAWGVVDSYIDTTGQWHTTNDESRHALHRAMGLGEGQTPPTDDPVRVIRQGNSTDMQRKGRLFLENGDEWHVEYWIPHDVPLGYHTFRPEGSDQSVRVIVAPNECRLPERLWGWSAQLYSMRSEQSWGFGDLADLGRLVDWAASLGATSMLINPIAAVAPVQWQQPSPYSPASRRFRNPLYLRVEDVPGASAIAAELAPLVQAGRALNSRELLDRDAVMRLKNQALEKIFARRGDQPGFAKYRQEFGRSLDEWGAYCVLAEKHGGDWRRWPEEFRRPDQVRLEDWSADDRSRAEYHMWLQWLLDEQLAAASKRMPIIHDLPIGFDPGGCDAWVWQDTLARDVSVGSPPDMYNTDGQNWGLPPFVPYRLRAAGYEPLIQTFRAALRHAGGLRIDHVMGLMRLFWIPYGMHGSQGAYVRYRTDETLAILALESQRAGAFVVGEDLGTVEPGTRELLQSQNILSYRLLWWEPQPTREYPYRAMVAASTHDLPTLAGVWTGEDLAAQQRAGIKVHVEGMHELRRRLEQLSGLSGDAPVDQVIERTYANLAQAPSLILKATLEDAIGTSMRVNIPGTVNEWPNWCMPFPGGIEALERSELARRIANVMKR